MTVFFTLSKNCIIRTVIVKFCLSYSTTFVIISVYESRLATLHSIKINKYKPSKLASVRKHANLQLALLLQFKEEAIIRKGKK